LLLVVVLLVTALTVAVVQVIIPLIQEELMVDLALLLSDIKFDARSYK
jgi:hypothetical protein